MCEVAVSSSSQLDMKGAIDIYLADCYDATFVRIIEPL